MKNFKIISIVALTIVTCAGIFLLYNINSPNKGSQIPSLSPRSDSNTLSEYRQAFRSYELLKEKITNHPDDPKNYVSLAQIFLQEARITGRHHEYIPKAMQLIETALSKNPSYFDAKVTKASVLLTLHQFEKAKHEIDEALKINNYSAAGWGVLVDALVELGQYDEAVKACDKMLSIKPDLSSYARASYLRELYGEKEAAVNAMILASNSGVQGNESRAWSLYNLGNLLLNEGKKDSALVIFKGILEERPGYEYALSGIADVYAAQKKYSDALEYYVKAINMTSNHVFLEKLADLYHEMNSYTNEKQMITRVLQSYEQHEKEGYNVDLEYARFCSNHNVQLNESLVRIEREYKRRPGNIDVLDTYAWLLFKKGNTQEAAKHIKEAMRLNTERLSINRHAEVILNSNGNKETGTALL